MSGAAARHGAGELLHLVLDRRRTLDEAMAAAAVYAGLEGADRGFARAMASAALRHLGWIDRAVAPLLSRPLAATGPEIRALIRIGAAQVWFLDVAPHAAVSATVDAARLWKPARSGGSFLNAAMRRIAETPSPAAHLPPEDIWPDWLRAAIQGSIGDAAARTLAAAQLTEPGLHLTARGDPRAVARQTGGALLPGGTVALAAARVEDLPGYAAGEWWVQDAAAAIPARLLAPAAGERVLDLCAAPGGKTLQLAAMGAAVTALDRSAPRLDRLRDNLARTRLSAEIVTADAETWTAPALFPKILLDAPCSAMGTLRRHPEGAWIKSAAAIARLPGVQARLLAAAARLLAPGGHLVYCVCTPLYAEGPAIASQAGALTGLLFDPINKNSVPGFEHALRPDGTLMTIPAAGAAHDAFFIARFRKART